MSEWVDFNPLDFLERKQWPRVLSKKFFQINPLGEVRYLNVIGKPEYRKVKPAILNGKSYFMATVGWSLGSTVVVRIPIADLVKRFFNS